MTKNASLPLAVVLSAVTTWSLACSGSHTSQDRATGTAGSGAAVSGTPGMAVSSGSGSVAGAGRGGSGGMTASSNARTPCGTANNGMGCSANPSSNDLCDLANSRCVDCLTDADCSVEPDNPHCDTRLNAQGLPAYSCEECVDDSHCSAGESCLEGACRMPCGTTMCDSDEVCDLANNRCVECGSDADCADERSDRRCDLRPNLAGIPTGNCEECLETSHCPAGQMCVNENCEPTCTTDMDCSANGGNNSYCHPTRQICGECGTDAHCASNMNNPYCTPDGDCKECTADSHCATQMAQPYCLRNNCSECMTNAHCADPTQPYCADGECVACRTTADCTSPQICNNNGNCSGG
jgi:hypothetical protein